MTLLRRILSARWNFVRLLLAGFLLAVVALDTPARLARIQLASLPGFDYAGESATLREQGRFGEALAIIDAGLSRAAPSERGALEQERARVISERDSVLRMLRDAGVGALTGRGDSLESLLGAVGADMLVVGDVRDLVIEGSRLALDGETDEVILALSAAGLGTTLVPQLDWMPAILKASRKAGAMGARFAEEVVLLARRGDSRGLRLIAADLDVLSKRVGPGGAARLVRHAQSPADLATLARFAEKHPDGAFALLTTGEGGAKLLTRSDGAPELAEGLVLKAAHKGPAGQRFLGTDAAKMLLRPHPLLGLAKGVWKGNIGELVNRVLERLDASAFLVLPLLGAWVVLELALLARRLAPGALTPVEPRRLGSR